MIHAGTCTSYDPVVELPSVKAGWYIKHHSDISHCIELADFLANKAVFQLQRQYGSRKNYKQRNQFNSVLTVAP